MSDEPHTVPDKGRAGADARNKVLSPERKKEIAEQAAAARWAKRTKAIEIRKAQADAPQPVVEQAVRSAELFIGSWMVPCHVLANDMRVISQRSLLELMGIRGKSTLGGEKLISFLDHPSFRGDSVREIILAIKEPVKFLTITGFLSFGYTGETVVDYCRAILKARQSGLFEGENFRQYAMQAEMLLSSVAKVGIVALIDEATGHQDVRARDDLQKHLEKYLKKEFAAWAKRFPDEFYMEIYRLKGWHWKGMALNRPQVVGTYTNDLIYSRLTPGILQELQALNPSNETGLRHHRHHQHLTPDIGHPALQQHLYGIVAMMRASTSWIPFLRLVDRAFPRIGDTYALALNDDELNPQPRNALIDPSEYE